MRINSKVISITFIIVILLLVTNNSSYYWYTKSLLTQALSERMESTANQIRTSIEQSEEGSFFVEDLIGENLRSVALFAASRLDPNIDNVSNEQLVQLAKQAGVDGFSLMKRNGNGNDIMIGKSSEPKELQITSTIPFGYWFTAFDQLMTNHHVTIPEGQKLPNFWSGIYEVPASGSSNVSKFGYFYDGTTNYIICVFVNAAKIQRFKEIVGADTIVKKTVAANPDILEISGLNGKTFGTKPIEYKGSDGTAFISVYDRPLLFGSYNIKSDQDLKHYNEAIANNAPVSVVDQWNGKPILKTFVYVPVKQKLTEVQREVPYVITIVSDYQSIQQTLNKQLVQLLLLVILLTVFSVVFMYVVFRFVTKSRETAVQTTQEMYIQNVDLMFATIRSQRHDFLNHVQTMYALLANGKKEDQMRYMKELLAEINEVNDIIRIGHPAIAALIQAKFTLAMRTKIDFHYEFTGLEGLSLGVKSVDIVKIIGNLIDNAFDEVNKFPLDEREVIVNGWSESNHVIISVSNPVQPDFQVEDYNQMFMIGYSTKGGGEHQGLGLSVVKERIEHYKGTIEVSVEDGWICFKISIPMQ
ncbi:sensor histidine kinase [Paenibacillus sp. GCM10023248]|uniref:sensor histidine kinase n=1 Tax=Bacillales TaxID=1385 RepID=UPI002378F2C2|nr:MULTISPECIES: GHKL domain-containing protein [Bacillales]MDD9268832.1 GHKL domain-containing protein [Paenibacillus sp. MAHUQ-63]MDR6882089.1 signal transduction histidine kinase [Bacillus sp. 3255]